MEQQYAKVWTKTSQSPNRYFTRIRNDGFTFPESVVIGVVWLVVSAIGVWISQQLLGSKPLLIPAIALWPAVKVAWYTRRINTDERPFHKWLVDVVGYHLRAHPLRAARFVSGQPYQLPPVTHTVAYADVSKGVGHDGATKKPKRAFWPGRKR